MTSKFQKNSIFYFLNSKFWIFIFLFFYFLFSESVSAAVLYLEPANGEFQPGDTFIVNVRIDPEGECINTVKANLSFSKDALEVLDFIRGDSILTFWVKSPEINKESGLISFAGGIPGGYCGIIPGDPGESNLLGKIIFKAKGTFREQFSEKVEFLDSSQVLLNDGLGTGAKLNTKGAVFSILSTGQSLKDEWQVELEKDTIPPEPFGIEANQDPAIFEGKYFLIFFTTDKQTGVDHYEILETDRRGYQEGTKRKAEWKRGESPYLLEDQSLESIIKVRAVDKAGNDRLAEYIPPEIAKRPFPYWIIGVIIGGLAIAGLILRKFLIPKS